MNTVMANKTDKTPIKKNVNPSRKSKKRVFSYTQTKHFFATSTSPTPTRARPNLFTMEIMFISYT